MDESFQFIIESPQHTQGHKKRPRLVTSCDNCRLKKIKCLQPSPETKCEACKTARIPCRFRDRERYFAERSRAIAGGTDSSYGDNSKSRGTQPVDNFSVASSSSNSSPQSVHRSTSHSPKANGLVYPQDEMAARYQSYPPSTRRNIDPSYRQAGPQSTSSFLPSRSDSGGYNFNSTSAQLIQHQRPTSQSTSRHIHLFDPERPESPHPALMPHFMQLFFSNLGAEFTFLAYDEVLAQFWEQTLPPLLANCIASMAARFSDMPELSVRGLHNVSETYADTAKEIASSILNVPSIETLYSLILIAWYEYKGNRIAGLKAYCPLAMRMGVDLGLSDQNGMTNLSLAERNQRRSAWASLVQLHLTASSYH